MWSIVAVALCIMLFGLGGFRVGEWGMDLCDARHPVGLLLIAVGGFSVCGCFVAAIFGPSYLALFIH